MKQCSLPFYSKKRKPDRWSYGQWFVVSWSPKKQKFFYLNVIPLIAENKRRLLMRADEGKEVFIKSLHNAVCGTFCDTRDSFHQEITDKGEYYELVPYGERVPPIQVKKDEYWTAVYENMTNEKYCYGKTKVVSVVDQIEINWDEFAEYFWSNIKDVMFF